MATEPGLSNPVQPGPVEPVEPAGESAGGRCPRRHRPPLRYFWSVRETGYRLDNKRSPGPGRFANTTIGG